MTRGDGKIGDDVSANVVRMKGFIPKLKDSFTGALRAEIILFHDIFEQKYSDKQNCRNAAGIVRRKDGVGSGDLNLIYYDAISLSDDVIFKNEIEKFKWLKEQNFQTVRTKTVKSVPEVIQAREEVMTNIRNTLEFDIDGLVIKGKEIDVEDMKRAKPMKQIAFKFQVEEIDCHENIVVLSDFTIKKISQEVNVPFDTTEGIINQCLLNIFYFKRALNCVRFIWNNDMDKLRRRLRVYLCKAHRIAPVFDYKRARTNSETLITLMNRSCYFPRFTTQLALIIFVTDANNQHKIFDIPILQRNLRAFCDCSAFAFHRARNKLRINNQGKIY